MFNQGKWIQKSCVSFEEECIPFQPGLSEIPAPDRSQEVMGHTHEWPVLIGYPMVYWYCIVSAHRGCINVNVNMGHKRNSTSWDPLSAGISENPGLFQRQIYALHLRPPRHYIYVHNIYNIWQLNNKCIRKSTESKRLYLL